MPTIPRHLASSHTRNLADWFRSQMSEAFQLHQTLSSTARAQTTLAVSLDETQRTSLALAAYDRAAELLTSYTRSFKVTSPAFAKLLPQEQAIVSQTHAALCKHLTSVNNRRQDLRSGSVSHLRPQQSRSVPPQSGAVSKLSRDDPLVRAIEAEILDNGAPVSWDDIYGLDEAKRALQEMVVLPTMRPDLYKGLRAPGRGILLFGPPGTGKTLVAKAVASNANATFFSISASSLNSKFHGESERLVRTLFQVARERQPSFVFIDEVDSILGARSDNEHEASRRLKTEFMAQFDGAMGGSPDDKVYVMAASNRPQDLDDAVRRRLDRRIYVPLPDADGRKEFFRKLTAKNREVRWSLTAADFDTLARRTANFSGSDIKALCREASLMPLRELGPKVSEVRAADVRACGMNDFEHALEIVRPSSNTKQIEELEKWNREFGSQPTPSKPEGAKQGKSTGARPRRASTTQLPTESTSRQLVVPEKQVVIPRPRRSVTTKVDGRPFRFTGRGKTKK